MIACKHCATLNSLDSAFCKRCGTTLPEDEVQAARSKNEEIVSQGMTAFSEGKLAEAMAIAETAVLSDRSSTTALALKVMVHEREGNVADALDCYERIVEMNPDSTLDKIKLNQLRNALANRANAPTTSPRMAWLAGVAACALVVSVGALVAKMNSGGEVAQKEGGANLQTFEQPNQGTPQDQNQILNQKAGPGTGNQNQTQEQTNQQGNQNNGVQPQGDDPRTSRSNPNLGLPTIPKGSPLPEPTESQNRPFDEENAPLPVNPPVGNDLRVQPRDPDPNGDPDPGTTRPANNNNQTDVVAPPKTDPGIMEIKVSKGGSRNVGGNRIDGNGVQALVRTANAQYEIGNHAQAANTYERALKAGGDPGMVNQRLGQAYDRMGRKGEAIAAYDRSIAALEAAIASGKGDTSRLKNALDSAKQARKAAGGN